MNGFIYDIDAEGIVTITLDMAGTTNVMGTTFADDLGQVVDRLEKEKESLKGVIVTSAKRDFLVGADLEMIKSLSSGSIEDFFSSAQKMKAHFRRLETLGRPVVAAINGSALGGGCELTLACHHRIALTHPKIQIGMPEVQVGSLPGGGGIVKSVRLLGLAAALPLLLEGKRLNPSKALAAGLIHELADDADDLKAKAVGWIHANPKAKQPWDEKGYKIPGGDLRNPKVLQMVQMAPGVLRKRTKGLLPAPEAILDVAVSSLKLDFETALRIETREMARLNQTPEAKNMINTFFFNLKDVRAYRPEGIEKSKVNVLGVVGAGMMGQGIAYVSAKAGIEVRLVDVDLSAAEKGKAYSEKILDKAMAKGRKTEEQKKRLLERIKPSADQRSLEGCDLIIETVFEDLGLKHKIVKDCEPYLVENGMMSSNTSSLPIAELAKPSEKPENFIGLHFQSPVDRMPCVEIIATKDTSQETIARSLDYARQINKIPVLVNDGRGFFTTRVFMTYGDEGTRMLEEGVDPVLIENLSKAAGFPIGPLAVMDEVSQKTSLKVLETNLNLDQMRGENTVDTNSPVFQIQKQLIEDFSRGGRAYGGGFYEYPQEGRKYIWPKLYELYHKEDLEISHQDIQDRFMYRWVIESLHCLEEGVLNTIRDANIGTVMAIGFPAHTGGVFQFINMLGPKAFYERTRELRERYGERFAPPEILKSKIQNNDLFLD
jgi:3-hydroxyacyl-CoA dehydrogenase/enoyl-CoA hydratase/3-hydroxybutyryl-CoA epimerase